MSCLRRVHRVQLAPAPAPARWQHCTCAQPPAFSVARLPALGYSRTHAQNLECQKGQRDAEAGGCFALEFPTVDAIAEGGPPRQDAGLRVQAEHRRCRGRQEQQQQQPGAGGRSRQGPGSPHGAGAGAGYQSGTALPSAPCWRVRVSRGSIVTHTGGGLCL